MTKKFRRKFSSESLTVDQLAAELQDATGSHSGIIEVLVDELGRTQALVSHLLAVLHESGVLTDGNICDICWAEVAPMDV